MKKIYAVEVMDKRIVSVAARSRRDAVRRVNRGEGDYITEGGDEIAIHARLYNPDKKYAVLRVGSKRA